MPITLNDRILLSAGDTDIVSVNCTPYLDSGELVASVSSVVDVASVLTIDNIVVNAATLIIKGETVAVGKAIQFRVAGGVAGTEYRVRYTLITDGTPARTAVRDILVCVL